MKCEVAFNLKRSGSCTCLDTEDSRHTFIQEGKERLGERALLFGTCEIEDDALAIPG